MVRNSFFVVAAALIVGACGPDTKCKTPNAPPSYATDGIQAIVETNCIPCHTNRGTQKVAVPDGTYYNTFAGMQAQAQVSIDKVATGNMPPATETPLSAADKEKFVQWASCGANP